VVAALTDDFEGGEFRTHEVNGSQLVHPLWAGGGLCLVSHKYHNVQPLTEGVRRSLVLELWQGGISGLGRS
jgi:predicted 2-oxoglutarate/Fe(II)-dependent dioxygenase YbiX